MRSVGTKAALAKYNNAKGILDYISSKMPRNAPGNLTREEYQAVISFLLLRNNLVSPSANFNEGQLSSVTVK